MPVAALDFVARGLGLRLLLLDARFELLDLGAQLAHVGGVAAEVEWRETATTLYPRGSGLHPRGAKPRSSNETHQAREQCQVHPGAPWSSCEAVELAASWWAAEDNCPPGRSPNLGQIVETVSGCGTPEGGGSIRGRRLRT